MDGDELRGTLEPWLTILGRAAWIPDVVDGEDPRSRHRFGGPAWLRPGEAPPTCGVCQGPLQPMVQLDLDDLPPDLVSAFGGGLLQAFYCIGDTASGDETECWADSGWEAFSPVGLVRVVGPDVAPRANPTVGHGAYAARSIVAWNRIEDRPDFDDLSTMGLEITINDYADFNERGVPYDELDHRVRCAALDLDVIVQGGNPNPISEAAARDKLAGWPRWCQSTEYPNCPRCHSPMQLIFQLDSDDHLPFAGGGGAIGHVTQCAGHHDVVAFAWAS